MKVRTNAEGEWVRSFRSPAETGVRLVCFPHAGGSASYYFPMSGLLGPDVELVALQYPGRQDRCAEKCVDNVPDLADQVFAALRGWTDRPFAFFGHSMGAILAFEVARRFQRGTARGPVWLFASGYPAPARLRGGTIHLRDDAGLVTELLSAGGTDPRWLDNSDLLASVLPPMRDDYKAIETHRSMPGPPLDCPITVLVGDADPQTTMDEAAAWRESTDGAFDLQVFAGGHFYLDEHLAEVSDKVSATLGRVLRA